MEITHIRNLITYAKNIVREKADPKTYHISKLVPKIHDLNVNPDGSSGYGTQMVQEESIDISGLNFIFENIRKSDEFQKVVSELVKSHPLPKKQENPHTQMEFWLETFLKKMIEIELQGDLDDNKEFEMILILKDELDSIPITQISYHHLHGLYLEDESIKISESILLRKSVPHDLEEIERLRSGSLRSMYSVPTSIIEIISKSSSIMFGSTELSTVLTILHLYRLSSIVSYHNITASTSVIWPGSYNFSSSLHRPFNRHSYSVTSTESNELVTFYNLLKNKVAETNTKNKENASISIALSRYSNALLEDVESERKLFSIVSGLEALYTQSGEYGESAYRLALRIGKILGMLGMSSINIQVDMTKSYKIRNKVGHGMLLDEKDRKESIELEKKLLEYLRLSIIIFLLSIEEKSKGRIIDEIDKSMINDESADSFLKWLRQIISVLPKSVFIGFEI